MVWVNSGSENSYWMPEVIPEYTEEWQTGQMSKSYLKLDGNVTGHPGWYFGNRSYVSDEYLFYNEGWYTIIDDDRPEETDSEGNKYIIIESPSQEWEIFDTYKIRKKYKKYLHIKISQPEYEFGKIAQHSFNYNDTDMTATDVYDVSYLPSEQIQTDKNLFLEKIRLIRNYKLDKTDYYVVLSKEKNMSLTEDFLSYRQNLRDIPEQFTFENLSENDFNLVNKNYNILSMSMGSQYNTDIDIDTISFFPTLPTIILE